jgi:hypothetical protein
MRRNKRIKARPFGNSVTIQRSPLWRSLASGKHTLTAARMTAKTFDESGDWRVGRQVRTR